MLRAGALVSTLVAATAQNCVGGYLGYPRIAFSGMFKNHVSTAFNDADNWNACRFPHGEFTEGSNLMGDSTCEIASAVVTSVTYEDGTVVTDPNTDSIIGMTVMDGNDAHGAKFMPLDTMDRFSAAIYGLQLEMGGIKGEMTPNTMQDLQSGEVFDPAAFSGKYVAPLTLMNFVASPGSRAMTELQACGGDMLSVAFTTMYTAETNGTIHGVVGPYGDDVMDMPFSQASRSILMNDGQVIPFNINTAGNMITLDMSNVALELMHDIAVIDANGDYVYLADPMLDETTALSANILSFAFDGAIDTNSDLKLLNDNIEIGSEHMGMVFNLMVDSTVRMSGGETVTLNLHVTKFGMPASIADITTAASDATMMAKVAPEAFTYLGETEAAMPLDALMVEMMAGANAGEATLVLTATSPNHAYRVNRLMDGQVYPVSFGVSGMLHVLVWDEWTVQSGRENYWEKFGITVPPSALPPYPVYYQDMRVFMTGPANVYPFLKEFMDSDNVFVMDGVRIAMHRTMSQPFVKTTTDPYLEFIPWLLMLSPPKYEALLNWNLRPLNGKGNPYTPFYFCPMSDYVPPVQPTKGTNVYPAPDNLPPGRRLTGMEGFLNDPFEVETTFDAMPSSQAGSQPRQLLADDGCEGDHYMSPNMGTCMPRKEYMEYCNAVQKCATGMMCGASMKCEKLCGEGTMNTAGVCTANVDAITKTVPGAELTFPPIYESAGDTLEITLRLGAREWEDQYYTCGYFRTFNGISPGPTIKARAGQKLIVHFINELGPEPAQQLYKMNGPFLPKNFEHGHNFFSPLNTSNLHLHGMHVTAHEPGDNVLVAVEPGESYKYEYEIPMDHMPGHHWYHPHWHGGSFTQVKTMFGNLVIVPSTADPMGFSTFPSILDGMRSIILTSYVPAWDSDYPYLFFNHFILAPLPQCFKKYPEAPVRYRTVNSQLNPTVTMASGEPMQFNWLNAESMEELNFDIQSEDGTDCTMHLMAKDGIPLYDAPRPVPKVYMGQGSRAEVIVVCQNPGMATVYEHHMYGGVFMTLNVLESGRVTMNATENRAGGADGEASAAAKAMDSQPKVTAAEINALSPLNVVWPTYLGDLMLDDDAITQRNDIKYQITNTHPLNYDKQDAWAKFFKPYSVINMKLFDFVPMENVSYGAIVETSLVGPQMHPHHQHTHPFQISEMPNIVLDYNGYYKVGDWHDLLLLALDSKNSVAKIRWTVLDFADEIMILHCHILAHEDIGMMGWYKIGPKPGEDAVFPFPTEKDYSGGGY